MQVPACGRSPYSFAVVVFLFALVLSGCSSGSLPVKITTTPTPPPKATVTLSVRPSAVMPGQTATLTWSSTDATSCAAGGAWSGTLATSGSMNVVLAGPAAETFTLNCTGAGFPAQSSATLSVGALQGACAPGAAVRARTSKRTAHRLKASGSHS